MDEMLLKVIEQGGTLALAGFSIWMLNKVWASRALEIERNGQQERESHERRVERERADKLLLIETLNRNTEALSALTGCVQRLDRLVTKKGD